MSARCKAKVWERSGQIAGWGSERPCSRDATRDGFCATHHPDAEKARRERVDARWKAERERDNRRANIEAAERAVVRAALAADEAGHQWNDRGMAEAVGVLRGLLAKRGAR